MSNSLVAGRYAKAVLELATESDVGDAVGEELETFQSVRAESPDLREVLANPVFSKEERLEVVKKFCAHLGLSDLTRRFLMLLVEKGRADALPHVVRSYRDQLDEQEGRVRAVVTSTRTLDEAAVDAIKKKLESTTGKTVLVTTKIDPELLGGIVTQVGSMVFDGSVRGRLEALRDRLIRNASQ